MYVLHIKYCELLYMPRQVIGEGSYGCVLDPSIHCKEKPTDDFSYDDKVSKIMRGTDANNEMNEFKLMRQIDPSNKYHIKSPHICSPKIDQTVANELKQCKFIDTKHVVANQDKYKLLVLQNGGMNLKQFANSELKKHLASGNVRHKLDLFWLEFYNLLKGIAHMYSNGLVHNDIKPQNVLYNPKSGEMKFIDFGLMRPLKEVIKSSEDSINNLATFHWSYPLDCGFMNKDKFEHYKRMSEGERKSFRNQFSKLILQSKSSDLSVEHVIKSFTFRNPSAFKIVFSYINKDLTVPDLKFQLGMLISFFDGLDECVQTMSYDEFLKKSTKSIDIFGLGMTIQFFVNAVNKVHALDLTEYLKLTLLCNKMYDFSPSYRTTEFEHLLKDYEYMLLTLGVTERLNLKMKSSPTSHDILSSVKNSHRSEKLSAELTEHANKDPVTETPDIQIALTKRPNGRKPKPLRPCKENQIRNTRTNRCISKTAKNKYSRALKPCPEGKTRNQFTNRCVYTSSFKRFQMRHANQSKPCKEGKERNPKTGRCKTVRVSASKKPCKDGKIRNPTTGRCKTVRASGSKKPCKDGKVRNPTTGRCRTIKASK